MTTSESNGLPLLIAVISSITGELLFFAQSGVHPPMDRALSAKTARTTTDFMAFLHNCDTAKPLPLVLSIGLTP
jgi:hypothetical protein